MNRDKFPQTQVPQKGGKKTITGPKKPMPKPSGGKKGTIKKGK